MCGITQLPLFKPQPKLTQRESLCSLVLRLYSDWIALPILIVLLLPFECVFTGYIKSTSWLPALDMSCVTLLHGGHVGLSAVMVIGYWIISMVIVFQLHCNSSHPISATWTDIRYMRLFQIAKVPMALVST